MRDDGKVKEYLENPPYRITNPPHLKSQITDYVQRSTRLYLKKYVDWSDGLVSETFHMTLRLAGDSYLINQVLFLWSATRLIEETWRICGEDTLGMEPVGDDSPWAGIIPVTPVMDQQLDQMAIREVLNPLKKYILSALHARFQDAAKPPRSKRNWLELFLVSFVLLHNCATQLGAEQRFAERYGMSGRFGPFGHYKDAEDQFDTARVILVYFHEILQGASVLTGDKRLEFEDDVKLDGEQLAYLQNLRQWISDRKMGLIGLQQNHQYEHQLYFIPSLLYQEARDPRPSSIRELPTGESTPASFQEFAQSPDRLELSARTLQAAFKQLGSPAT